MHQPLFKIISIDALSATPKYLQLVQGIINAVDKGSLEEGQLLPSINDISAEMEVSRDTAEKAYRQLKKRGVLESVPGKGYFIKKRTEGPGLKVFLLFNKLSAHKKIVYDALTKALGDTATIDLYIYHNDFSLFKKIIEGRRTDYTHYVILPHFLEGGEKAAEILNSLTSGKLILLDKIIPGITIPFAAVYENFEEDIFSALEEAKDKLSGYKTIKLIFPEYTYYPEEIIKGFKRFCQEYAFTAKLVHDISCDPLSAGEVYISVMENDLVILIERLLAEGLKIGKEVGVISYNETPLKKIILNGITTISTDFQLMGEMTAKLISEKENETWAVPFRLTLRPSI